MSLEVCMDSRRRWVSARKWYNQGLLIHIETTYSSGSPWAQNRLILREYFYSFLSICLWPMLELMQTHCYWILSMSDSDALTLQPQTVRKEKGCWMRWTFGLTQHSHFSVLLRPALTKFRTTFKCLLNTFKTGLDICMSSALSMSLSLTVHVCIYFFFFWIEVLLKSVYLLTGHKIETSQLASQGRGALDKRVLRCFFCSWKQGICVTILNEYFIME